MHYLFPKLFVLNFASFSIRIWIWCFYVFYNRKCKRYMICKTISRCCSRTLLSLSITSWQSSNSVGCWTWASCTIDNEAPNDSLGLYCTSSIPSPFHKTCCWTSNCNLFISSVSRCCILLNLPSFSHQRWHLYWQNTFVHCFQESKVCTLIRHLDSQ